MAAAAEQMGVDAVVLLSRGGVVRAATTGRLPVPADSLRARASATLAEGIVVASPGTSEEPALAAAPLGPGVGGGAAVIMAHAPRSWTAAELDSLQAWARAFTAARDTLRSRARLRRERDDFESLARHNPDLVVRFDSGQRHVYVNPAVEAATGLKAGDFLGRTNEEMGMPEEQVAAWNAARQSVLDTGEPRTIEFSYPGPDGERHYQSRIVPEVRPDGSIPTILGITRDITSMKRVEAELRESRRELEDFFENATVGLHMVGPDGTVLWANRHELEMLGYTRDEYVGRNIAEFHADRPVIEEILARLHAGEALHEAEARLRCRDGSVRHVLISSSVHFEDGEFMHTRCFTTDVTDRKRAQEAKESSARALERQSRLTRAITTNATAALFMMDSRGRCTFMNPAAERMTGFTLDEIRGRALHDVIHHTRPDGSPYPMAECPIDRALPDNRTVRNHEDVFIRKDGTFFPVLCFASPLTGDADAGTVVEVLDMTEARAAERERERLIRELEHERNRLHGLFIEAPAFMVILRGPDHIIEAANPAFIRTVGARQVLGRSVAEVLPELEGQGYCELLDEVYRTGESHNSSGARVALQREAGATEEVFVNFVFQAMLDTEDRPAGIFVHGVEVTELVRAREEARAASDAKSGFLATVSHELRTPLNAMLGYTELLQLGVPDTLPDGAAHHVQRIEFSARHLLELIEEILSFSRIEAGQERVQIEGVPLATLFAEVAAIIEPLAEARGLKFRIEAEPGDREVRTDPRKLRQILLNLLGNAVKFTEQGEVVFRYGRDGDHVLFQVADTGVGIDPAHLDRIFEAFWQGESSHSGRAGGTGLGLAVAREFARLLGGDIEVETRPGPGSTFTLRLPASPAP